MVLALLLPLAACAGGSGTAAPAAPPTPRAAAASPISPLAPAALKGMLEVYAADSMMGREAGTIGNVKATDYLAARLKPLGLEPGGPNGSWFQEVPVARTVADPKSTVRVGGTSFAFGKDFLLFGGVPQLKLGGTLTGENIPTVYGGRSGDKSVTLNPEDAAGKLVVLDPPVNQAGEPTWQFWPTLDRAKWDKAAGIAIIGRQLLPDGIVDFLQQPGVFLAEDSVLPPAPAGTFLMLVTPAMAEQMLGAPTTSLKPGAAGRPVSASVRTTTEKVPTPSRNVIAIVRGSDPVLKNQYVAIGAHNDHIGMAPHPVDHDSLWAFNRVMRPRGAESEPGTPTPEQLTRIRAILDSLRKVHPARLDSVYNGADDDGSGSVSLLGMADAFTKAKVKPKRSILFVWHTAEEKGLWGSQWFTDHPTVPRDSIVAQLNMDMIGRGNAWDIEGGSPKYLQLVGSRRLSTELGDLVEKVNTEGGFSFAFDYSYDANGHPANIYCRSDHYMYARYGIPVTFFTTDVHPDYHQLTDEAAYIDYTKMARVADLVANVGLQVANLDHRILVDKPKPDPKAQCQQ